MKLEKIDSNLHFLFNAESQWCQLLSLHFVYGLCGLLHTWLN